MRLEWKHWPFLKLNKNKYVRQKQLLVDVSTIWQRDSGTGIQRIIHGEMARLASSADSDFEIRPIVATRKNFYRYVKWPRSGTTDVVGARVRARDGDIFYGLDLCAHILPCHARRLRKWRASGVRFEFMIYDLLPLTNPEWFSDKLVKSFRKWLNIVGQLANEIKCLSYVVKDQVTHSLVRMKGMETDVALVSVMEAPRRRQRFDSVSGVLDEKSARIIKQVRLNKTALMVGTLEPRKGHDEVIDAFDHLWKSGKQFNLILIGRPGWKTDKLQAKILAHTELNNHLFWLDNANDITLHTLYSVCDGVIIASLAEGLGLPIIEALAYNKPVLARDIPVFREVADSNTEVQFFNKQSNKIFSEIIAKWLAKRKKIYARTKIFKN